MVGLGFLQSVSYTKKGICCVKKSDPSCHFFNLIFLGLGWPWVGALVGFMVIPTSKYMSPTRHNLVNRKHPNNTILVYQPSMYHTNNASDFLRTHTPFTETNCRADFCPKIRGGAAHPTKMARPVSRRNFSRQLVIV